MVAADPPQIAAEPNHAGCLAMLAIVYADGYLLGFRTEDKQADQGVSYARRAVAADRRISSRTMPWPTRTLPGKTSRRFTPRQSWRWHSIR